MIIIKKQTVALVEHLAADWVDKEIYPHCNYSNYSID